MVALVLDPEVLERIYFCPCLFEESEGKLLWPYFDSWQWGDAGAAGWQGKS